MGKATELDDYHSQHPLTPEQIEARHTKIPELRLRTDVPAIEVDENTRARDVLERLRSENIGGVALRDPNGAATAMVVSAERYLELVGTSLANDRRKEGATDGRIIPTEAAFEESYVEQVDPQAAWHPPLR